MHSEQIVFKKLSIVDFLNIITLSLIIIFYIIGFGKTPYKTSSAIVYSVLLLFIMIISGLRLMKDFRFKKFLLLIYPMIFFFSLFESFYMILPYFNTMRFDWLMISIDHWLLGVHPTVWIEKIFNPFLTDIMYLAYIFYFPMPLILAGWLFYRKKYAALEEAMVLIFLCYYGAYVTYFFIPVSGPRFNLAAFQTLQVTGLILTDPIRALVDFFEPNKLDCFPSLHAAILIVTMFLTYKNNKKLYYFYLPISIVIMISLVYCRYHYVIDILAGSIWGITCITIGRFLYYRLKNRFIFHFN